MPAGYRDWFRCLATTTRQVPQRSDASPQNSSVPVTETGYGEDRLKAQGCRDNQSEGEEKTRQGDKVMK